MVSSWNIRIAATSAKTPSWLRSRQGDDQLGRRARKMSSMHSLAAAFGRLGAHAVYEGESNDEAHVAEAKEAPSRKLAFRSLPSTCMILFYILHHYLSSLFIYLHTLSLPFIMSDSRKFVHLKIPSFDRSSPTIPPLLPCTLKLLHPPRP